MLKSKEVRSESVGFLTFYKFFIAYIFFSLDAVREVRKYSAKEHGTDAKLQPNMYDHLHMKLFRAQRNLYISGFAVFLWLWVFALLHWYTNVILKVFSHTFVILLSFCRVMKRVVTLINQLAAASVTTAAIQAQADNSDKAAKKYMEDNELLKQVGFVLFGQDSKICC